MTKYITKSIGATAHGKNEHLFYASKGLKGKENIAYSYTSADADYEGEWCGLTWIDPRQSEALTALVDALGDATTDAQIIEAIIDEHKRQVIHSQYAPQAQNIGEQEEQLTFFGKESGARGAV